MRRSRVRVSRRNSHGSRRTSRSGTSTEAISAAESRRSRQLRWKLPSAMRSQMSRWRMKRDMSAWVSAPSSRPSVVRSSAMAGSAEQSSSGSAGRSDSSIACSSVPDCSGSVSGCTRMPGSGSSSVSANSRSTVSSVVLSAAAASPRQTTTRSPFGRWNSRARSATVSGSSADRASLRWCGRASSSGSCDNRSSSARRGTPVVTHSPTSARRRTAWAS